ncbi:MAG: phospholipid carrier-dependent glycosyltransferase, partial [Anaerolineae bacterium]|nr:phospholipid carrier-dependent glycosyltransferase [Anaerolineae bacterium]
MRLGWPRRVARPRLIWAILGAYLVLATIYNVTVPIFEAPDEFHHYFYIKHLADGDGLPIQRPGQNALWAQEGSQPPLYYAAAALLTRWIDTSDALGLLWFNPHANIGDPTRPGNKNRFVHLPRERWPYHGTVLAMHLIRLFSTLLGAGTVYLTFKLAQGLLPNRPVIASGAAALVAFTPQFDFIHAAVSNDAAITFLSTLSLWWLVQVLQGKDGKVDLALGVTLGLAALAKLSGLFLWPLTGVILAVRAATSHRWRRLWRDGLLIFGIASLISAWWYVRNWRLYGDPTGLNVMIQIVGPRHPPPTLSQLSSEFEGLRISYWALFGWFSILVPRWLYRAMDAISLVAAGGLLWGIWRQGSTRIPRDVWLLTLLAGWFALLLAGLVRWTSLTPGTQGRLLFPAISAGMILMAVGWCRWAPKPWRAYWMGALATFMFLFALACPFWVIRPAYARPALIPEADIPESALTRPIVHGGMARVLGARLSRDTLHPGETTWLTVYWEPLVRFDRDYVVFVHLLTPKGRVIGQMNTWPGLGTMPTRLLRPGKVLVDRYPIQVDHDTPAPTIALVEVGLFDANTQRSEPSTDPDGNPVGKGVG